MTRPVWNVGQVLTPDPSRHAPVVVAAFQCRVVAVVEAEVLLMHLELLDRHLVEDFTIFTEHLLKLQLVQVGHHHTNSFLQKIAHFHREIEISQEVEVW